VTEVVAKISQFATNSELQNQQYRQVKRNYISWLTQKMGDLESRTASDSALKAFQAKQAGVKTQ
jgi:hypothetical protein